MDALVGDDRGYWRRVEHHRVAARRIMILLLLGSGAGLLTLILDKGNSQTSHSQPLNKSLATASSRAGIGALCLLAVVGLSAFIGSFTMFLAILAATTSPKFLRFLTRKFVVTTPIAPALPDSETKAPSIPAAIMDTGISIETLSYEDLCRTWRSTYLPVKVADDAGSLESLSALRRACLDELERRDHLRRWFIVD